MVQGGSNWAILGLVITSSVLLYFCNKLAIEYNKNYVDSKAEFAWVLRALTNILGYSTILVPGVIVHRYIRKTNYVETISNSFCAKLVKKCFEEDQNLDKSPTLQNVKQRTQIQSALLLLFYFTGLQVSFLTWGILQEKIMTQNYAINNIDSIHSINGVNNIQSMDVVNNIHSMNGVDSIKHSMNGAINNGIDNSINEMGNAINNKNSVNGNSINALGHSMNGVALSTNGRFTDSQFLVFVNRILAFLMSGVVILFTRQPRNRCPLYKYAFCSISNILSSWCQYEALKFVSFPNQVLAKASKTIPVMIMGKIVSRAKYEYYEYVTAFVLSIGMLFFMLDTGKSNSNTQTTFSGVVLLIIYIVFDSFTSNWQGALFKQFNMSPVQMMCGVNLFSCVFTAVSLLQQNGFLHSMNFMISYPAFIFDCFMLSICSAAGQLFIFNTIANFGPLVFAIISTVRQGFAVFLSCLIFGHHIDVFGIFGVFLVFFSIFLRIYCSYRVKSLRKKNLHSIAKI